MQESGLFNRIDRPRERTATAKFYNSANRKLRYESRGDRGNIYEGGLFGLSLGGNWDDRLRPL